MTITQAVRNLVAAMYRQTSGLGDGTPSAGDVEMQSDPCGPRVRADDNDKQQFGQDGGKGNLDEHVVKVEVQSVQRDCNLELQSRQGSEGNLDQVQGQQNDDFPSRSRIIELSLLMALGFLGIAYQNNIKSKNNPIVTTAVPFKLMMLSLAVTVSASMAGGFFLHFLPCFSKILHGASVFSCILQLSVLMWVSLPTNLKWVAWCFSLYLLFSLLTCFLCPNWYMFMHAYENL